MLTHPPVICEQQPRRGLSYRDRRAALETLKHSARHDCRPHLRAEIRAALNGDVAVFALWLTDRFTWDGDLYGSWNRRTLLAASKLSPATFTRRLAALTRAGLIKRTHTGRIDTVSGEYRHVVIIAVADRFRPVSPVPSPQRADLRNAHPELSTPLKSENPTRVDVVDLSSVGDARARETIDEETPWAERAALLRAFGSLYRSRTDVPLNRPGYANRYTVRDVTCMTCGQTGHTPNMHALGYGGPPSVSPDPPY